MRGVPLTPAPAASVDSWTLAVVLALLIALGFNAPHVERLFRTFFTEIWSVRQRNNIFGEHVTSETQALLLMLLLTSVMEGLIISTVWPAAALTPIAAFGTAVACTLAFNLFSVLACRLVGFVFTTAPLASQWRRGLYASQAMLGLALLLPALTLIVRNSVTFTPVVIAAAFYIVARLLFIVKGFRIFYTNFYSLLYFILYLCTLEIIPVLVLVRVVAHFANGNSAI